MNRIMDERVNGMNRRDGYKVALNGTNWDEYEMKITHAYIKLERLTSCVRPN